MSDKVTEQAIKSVELAQVKNERILLALFAIRAKNEDPNTPPFFGDDPPTHLHTGLMGNLHLHVRDTQHMWVVMRHFGHIKSNKQWLSGSTNSAVLAFDWTDFNVPIWVHIPLTEKNRRSWCVVCPQVIDLSGDGCVGCNCPQGDNEDEVCQVCGDLIDDDGYYDDGFCKNHPPDVIAHPCSGIAATQNHESAPDLSKIRKDLDQ
jgi:hypothetical protein